MSMLLCCLAWEWINIALEYTAVAWVRLPKLFLSVVGVNLVTHPVFMVMLERFGRDPLFYIIPFFTNNCKPSPPGFVRN